MNFVQYIKEHRQQALLGVFGGLAIVASIVIWYVYFRDVSIQVGIQDTPPPTVEELDFGVFDDPAFLELGSTSQEISAPEETGRTNPFSSP